MTPLTSALDTPPSELPTLKGTMPSSTRDESGVTIVELMVGLVVLAILLAIAVPYFATSAASARDDSVRAEAQPIALLAEQAANNSATGVITIADLGQLQSSDGIKFAVVSDADTVCVLGYHERGRAYAKGNPFSLVISNGGERVEGDCPLNTALAVWR